jgi:hypothetical protein
MLIAKLLGWFKRRQLITVFVLEIFAVFIGISVSLLVDDWRQTRIDQGQLHKILTQVHSNVLEHRDQYRYQVVQKTLASEDTLALALRKESLWPGASSGGSIFALIFDEPFVPNRLVGLERLISSELLSNFTELRTDLDRYHDRLQSQIVNNQKMLDVTTTVQIELFQLSGIILAQGNPTFPEQVTTLSGMEQRHQDFATAPYLEMDRQELNDRNSAVFLAAVERDDFRALLTTLASLHVDGASEALKMESLANDLIATIETFAPDIRLRFDTVGIDGTATGRGFSENNGPSLSIPMSPSSTDADVWLLTTDLVSGDLVFRADNSWDQHWGAPYTYRNIKRGSGYEFFGDPADVFPKGAAESRGLDIPVDPGRYEIKFNSYTLEYSFDLVSEP